MDRIDPQELNALLKALESELQQEQQAPNLNYDMTQSLLKAFQSLPQTDIPMNFQPQTDIPMNTPPMPPQPAPQQIPQLPIMPQQIPPFPPGTVKYGQ